MKKKYTHIYFTISFLVAILYFFNKDIPFLKSIFYINIVVLFFVFGILFFNYKKNKTHKSKIK